MTFSNDIMLERMLAEKTMSGSSLSTRKQGVKRLNIIDQSCIFPFFIQIVTQFDFL